MGPFVFQAKVGKLAYQLNLGTRYARIHLIFHISLLCRNHASGYGHAISTPIIIQHEQE